MSSSLQTRTALARTLVAAGLMVSGLTFGSAAHAAITFQFNFLDAAGVGFNDATTGADRQAAMNTAATNFSTMFGSFFSNTGTIVLDATGVSSSPTNLASAGSLAGVSGSGAGFNVAEVISTKLQTGTDLNGAAADGSVNVNFTQPWELSFGAVVSSSSYDFYTTIYHEFTHALGFSSLIEKAGTDLNGKTTAGNWGNFDQFITDKTGAAAINKSTFDLNTSVWAQSIGGTSPAAGLFFNGANAVAANGGQLVGLYTPTTWAEGSSVSHLDTDNPVFSKSMMAHATDTGPGVRTYSAVEVGIMTDLGYTAIAAVPEPESYAMMIAGLGVLGMVRRRRKA